MFSAQPKFNANNIYLCLRTNSKWHPKVVLDENGLMKSAWRNDNNYFVRKDRQPHRQIERHHQHSMPGLVRIEKQNTVWKPTYSTPAPLCCMGMKKQMNTKYLQCMDPDSKVHGANMGPIWGRQDPGGPHELCYLGNDQTQNLNWTTNIKCRAEVYDILLALHGLQKPC